MNDAFRVGFMSAIAERGRTPAEVGSFVRQCREFHKQAEGWKDLVSPGTLIGGTIGAGLIATYLSALTGRTVANMTTPEPDLVASRLKNEEAAATYRALASQIRSRRKSTEASANAAVLAGR